MRVTFINQRRFFSCLMIFTGLLIFFLLAASLSSPVWAYELINPDVLDQLKPELPGHDQIKLVPIKAPTNLTAASKTQGVITLRWMDQSDNEHGFIVERRGKINDFSQVAVLSRNTLEYTDSEASTYPIFPGETYYYRVKAFNDEDQSAYSNIVEITALKTAPPVAPVILHAEIVTSYRYPVQLLWEDRSNDETRFEVQRRREGHGYFVVADLPPDTTTYQDSFDYEEGATYYYRIEAFNTYGSVYSNEIPVYYPTQNISGPPQVMGVSQNSTTILLQWSHVPEISIPNLVQGYNINVGQETPLPYDVVGPDVTSLLITGLEPETIYRIAVSAKVNVLPGLGTTIKVQTGPPAPIQVKAVKKGDTSVELTWQTTSKYHPQLDYEIQFRDEKSSFSTFTRINQPETLKYLVTGLDPDKNYAFRVICYHVVHASDPSEVVVPIEETSSGLASSPAQVEIVLNVGQYAYSVNGQQKQMDAQPVIFQGRTLLPIRYITEALGAAIAWNGEDQKVTITQDEQIIELWVNNSTAMINGQPVPIDVGNSQVTPLIIPPGRTMLPLRFITESLGCQLKWDADTQQITIIRQ
ncbi:stalk domain-containing protein [Anoxynatronum buryatiense]|uniref:Fibronectin type III domain-containing protein n=1 Tax=Anoxynatronum buryatiense TaxID=489973 RepID=A0AA46AJZ6_9CLOT|nr:stalk domain-containing protein [Anoxynatronum buryatiense]SMP66112.1 Fibronectin type III domain-containing protein [Anoxynatronum buryatiense]